MPSIKRTTGAPEQRQSEDQSSAAERTEEDPKRKHLLPKEQEERTECVPFLTRCEYNLQTKSSVCVCVCFHGDISFHAFWRADWCATGGSFLAPVELTFNL